MPVRIQRKRTRGWKMPDNSVYVGRPSAYGNTHVIFEDCSTHRQAVALYIRDLQEWLERVGEEKFNIWIGRLTGKDLVCWCGPEWECHADVLLRLANTACSGLASPSAELSRLAQIANR